MMRRQVVLLGMVVTCMGLCAGTSGAADPASLSEHPVRFAILGDRSGEHVEGIYKQIVEEIERLKPEFVITVGDMIEGYTEDPNVINSEWKEYLDLVRPLSMPIHYTPGNHDITNDSMLAPYRQHIGDPYYSFDRRGVHIVILDNSRWESADELPAEQLDWLVQDLSDHRNASWTFVFHHKPFWYHAVAEGNPDTLHHIFVKYGVDVVFSGHYHQYFSGEYDGIKYASIGSSGGGMGDPQFGLHYHFAWVTVDDKDVTIAPVKMGSVLAADHVTADDLHLIDRLQREGVVMANPLPVDRELAVAEVNAAVDIHNYTDYRLSDSLVWKVPPGWTVTPPVQPLDIPPGGKLHLSTPVLCQGPLHYPVPSATVTFTVGEERTQPITKEIRFMRQLVCPYTDSPPRIDGQLTEPIWTNPERLMFGPDGSPPTVDSAFFYFAHDEDNLYLAARCVESEMDSIRASVTDRDGAVYGEDCVGYFFQPNRRQDTVYQVYVNPLGAVFDQKITSDEYGYYNGDRDWNGTYTIKTGRADGYWTFEAMIPFSELGLTEYSWEWGLNFRRKQKRLNSSCDWQVPIDYDPQTFGAMRLE